MDTYWRQFLTGIGRLAALVAIPDAASEGLLPKALSSLALPAKNHFGLPEGVTYMSSAITHQMPSAAARALRDYCEFRSELRELPKRLKT
jgi:hypothetical protein